MKFQQRLNRYLLGVALGLILVFVMFNGRDWLGWLPQNQVRKRIAATFQTPARRLHASNCA